MASKKKRQRGRKTRTTPARETPARATSFLGNDLVLALGLTVLAAVHRILFLRSNRDSTWPFTVFYEGDSETFFRFARAILEGEVYDSGIPFHPPGFAYFLAGVHRFLGAGAGVAEIPHVAVKTVLAVVGALSVGLVYLLVRPYLGRLAALLTAGLCLYHFGLYILSIATVSEGLYLTLLVLALLVFTRGLEHPLSVPAETPPSPRRQAVAGIVLGLLLGALALVRAEAVLIAGALVAVGLAGWGWRARTTSTTLRKLLPWGLAVLAFVAALAPWTIRNARQLETANERLAGGLAEPLPTFVPLTLYGPLNLALANHDGTDGTFSPDLLASLGDSGKLQLTDPEHLALLLHGDRRALSWIVENPGDWGALVLRKWSVYLRALSYGWTQWNVPAGLTGTRRPVDAMTPHSLRVLWLIAPLVVLGLALAWWIPGPTRRWAALVTLLTTLGLVTTAFFFGYARLGLIVVPLWMSLVALVPVGLHALSKGRPEHAPRDGVPRWLASILAALTVVLLVVELSGRGADRNFRATGTTLPGSHLLNRDLPIELEPIP